MIEFLIIASLATLITAWLIFLPLKGAEGVEKKHKQKTALFIFLLVIVFPLVFYLFISR